AGNCTMQNPAGFGIVRQASQRAEEIEKRLTQEPQQRSQSRKSALGSKVEIDIVQMLVIPLGGNRAGDIGGQIIQELRANLFRSDAHNRMRLDHLPTDFSKRRAMRFI